MGPATLINKRKINIETPTHYVAWDGTILLWKHSDNERPHDTCHDCKLPYPYGNDCSISHEIWEKINPTFHYGAGILCANCIMARLGYLGIIGVDAKLWPSLENEGSLF